MNELDKDKIYLIYCRSEGQSGNTLAMMKKLGFKEVYNMLGGITEWVKNGLPIVE